MEKKEEIKLAKKRRAKLLAEFNRLDWTLTKFGKKHNMSGARMGQLLKKARMEQGNCE